MSEAVALYQNNNNQYLVLRDVLARLNIAKQELEAKKDEVDSLRKEADCIAQAIYRNKISDEVYALAPTYTEKRSVTRVDNTKLKEEFPEIFEKANPHINGDGAWEILNSMHTPDELQSMLKNIRPDIYFRRATVTKAALESNCTAEEIQALESSGVLVTTKSFSEEPTLIRKDIHQARIEGAKKRAAARRQKEAEDMEDEE